MPIYSFPSEHENAQGWPNICLVKYLFAQEGPSISKLIAYLGTQISYVTKTLYNKYPTFLVDLRLHQCYTQLFFKFASFIFYTFSDKHAET